MDGDLKLYKRARSRAWQATFNIDGHWVRVSTKCTNLAEAKDSAKTQFLEYKFRQKNQMPVVSKRFADIARLAIAEMKKAIEAGIGKSVFRDYIIVIERYLIPFFGKMAITNIDYDTLQQFSRWRAEKMGREPKASTISTHNSALNCVFDEGVSRGFLSKSKVPMLINKAGRGSDRRPAFTKEEYRTLRGRFAGWVGAGRAGKAREMRLLLRDYVLILANTGIRHGTEAENLMWQQVHLFEEKGKQYLAMSVSGKTGRRDVICRANTVKYLKRIHERCADINHLTFEQLLKAKLDKPVFRLSDGSVSLNLRQTFKAYLTKINLLVDPDSKQDRTLYSLRHTYATFALVNDGMEIHTLAIQMGTSIQMIERHYSHLTPFMRKDMLTGPRYEVTDNDADVDDDGDV